MGRGRSVITSAQPPAVSRARSGGGQGRRFGGDLQEVGKCLNALVAAGVAAEVELLDVGHRLERLHERVQAVRVEAVAAQVDLRDRRVAHALLRDHLDARALHLPARAVEHRVLGVVLLDHRHPFG